MKLYILFLLSAFFFAATTAVPPATGTLELHIQNIKHSHGKIWVGIYPSQQAFLDKEQATLVTEQVVMHEGTQYVQLPNMPYGEYAIALFHDLNGNDLLDQNWIGIPQEPYAFSRPPASKWRVPRFSEVKVAFTQSNQRITTALTDW